MTESKKRVTRAARWLLTINNPTEEEEAFIAELKEDGLRHIGCDYLCAAKEVGKEGTEHWHIYIQFATSRAFSTIKNIFPRAHIERSLGNAEQNRAYVEKAPGSAKDDGTSIRGTFFEIGQLPESKIDVFSEVIAMMKDGETIGAVVNRYPTMIRYVQQLEKFQNHLIKDAIEETMKGEEVNESDY